MDEIKLYKILWREKCLLEQIREYIEHMDKGKATMWGKVRITNEGDGQHRRRSYPSSK